MEIVSGQHAMVTVGVGDTGAVSGCEYGSVVDGKVATPDLMAPQTAGNGPRLISGWENDSRQQERGNALWQGRWIAKLIGAHTDKPFEFAVGQAIAGLNPKDAENIRIYGCKRGWKMKKRTQPDGTCTVGRIEGVPDRKAFHQVRCSDGKWRSKEAKAVFDAEQAAQSAGGVQ